MNRKKRQEWIKNFISHHQSCYKPAKYLFTVIFFFRLSGRYLCRKIDREKLRKLMVFAAGSILVYVFIPYSMVKGLGNDEITVSGGNLDSGHGVEDFVSGGDSGNEEDEMPDSSQEGSVQGDETEENTGDQESSEPELGQGTQEPESGEPEESEETQESGKGEPENTQEGNTHADISSGNSSSAGPLANDFTVPSQKDSSAVMGSDVSGNDILSVTVPSKGLITIDPYNILGKGQIISPDFQFTNHSAFDVEVELASVDYELQTQTWGNTVKDCRLYWGTDVSSISLWPGHSENLEQFSLGKGNSRTYRFTGKLSENTEALWNSNDIKLNMVFRFRRTE